MTRYKITIEYDGTGLSGWQRQDDIPTLQQQLEEAICSLTSEKVEAIASGRTDAGVHALAQVVHFDLVRNFERHKILAGLNHYLIGKNISVLSVEEVTEDFHARFSAQKRYYQYIILNRRAPTVLDKDRVWHFNLPLDVDKMIEASKYLIGNHDFSSFRASECQSESPVKTLDELKIEKIGDKIYFYLSARSFLHHQCRNIVGTLKEVGEGKRRPDDIPDILEAKDRASAGVTAPAHGLYFVKVDY